MPLFDRFGRKKRRPQRGPGSGSRKAWWEIAGEFSSEAPYEPAEDLGSVFDPMGSYTGLPADGGEPVQDADDL